MEKTNMRYLVLDLETSGLDPAKDQILEVGAIAVTAELEEIARFERVVWFSGWCVEGVSPFVREMHTKNGLWGDCERAPASPVRVDSELAGWLVSLGARPGSVVLAGHSIHFDHGFLKAQFPETAKLLSHRLMDFGAFARFLRESCGAMYLPNAEMPHRAMADCEIELAEAREMRRAILDLGRGGKS